MSKWFKFTACDEELIFGFYAVHSQNDSVPIGFDSISVYTGNCQNLAHVQTFTNNSFTLNLIENNNYFIKIYPKIDNPEFYNIAILMKNISLWNCINLCNDFVINGDFETTSFVPYPLVVNPSNNMTFTNTSFSSPFNQYTITGYNGLPPFLPTGPGGITSDATTGTGNFLYLDAPSANTSIAWQQNNIPVVYGQIYQFSFFVKQIHSSNCLLPAIIRPVINNELGPVYFVNHPNWIELCYSWTPPSPSVQTVSLRIDITGGFGLGYDMGIDNISFGNINNFYISGPSEICENETLVLAVTNLTGQPPYYYLWSTGSTNQSISVIAQSTATYTVTVTDGNGCQTVTSHTVTVNQNPPPPQIDGAKYTCDMNDIWVITNLDPNLFTFEWWVWVNGSPVYNTFGSPSLVFDWSPYINIGGVIEVQIRKLPHGCYESFYFEVIPCCNLDNIPPADQIFYSSATAYNINGNYNNEVIVINGDVIFEGYGNFNYCQFYLSPFSTLSIDYTQWGFSNTLFTNCRDTVWKEIKILNTCEGVSFVGCTLQYSQSGITNDVGAPITVTESYFYNNYQHGLRLSNFSSPNVNISGNIFTCTDPADMIYPYNGFYPEKGIYLLNNNLLGGTMLNIGTNNNFSYIYTGIYSDNSDVNIFDNTFHSINFSTGFSAGIFATNLQTTNITNKVKIEYNPINNCRNGIHVSRNIDPTIQYNILTNNPNGVAITVMYLKYSNIAEIKYNNISNYGTGILATRNDKALINIRFNSISWPQFAISGTGIRIAGSLFPQEKYIIYHNTIINPHFGINILRLRKPFIRYNEIQNIFSSELVSNISTGILATNCRDACIQLNNVSGTSTPQEVSNIGIHFHTSNNTKVIENTLFNLGSCVRATYFCPNSYIHRNSFSSSYEGISLAVSGYIGPQSGIYSPSDNMWLPDLNHWAWPAKRVHFCYASDGSASPLYVNPNNGQNTTGVLTDYYYAENGGIAFTVVPTTGLSTINCGSSVLSPEVQISIDEAKKLIDELVNFPEYEEETRENVRRQLVALLSGDSLALADPEILAFWLEVQSEPLGISNEVQLLTELGQYLDAGILNLFIETLTVMEDVERSARNLQLKIFITDTMTTEDIIQLEEIAFLCPYTHGEGVYIARSLLSVIDPLFEYVNECELDPSFVVRSAQIQQNKTALKIYPNPVQDVLNFELLNLDSDQPVLIQVSDISGRIVLSTSVKVEGSNSIHVGKLESGCYLIKVNTDTVGTFSEKFCIIR